MEPTSSSSDSKQSSPLFLLFDLFLSFEKNGNRVSSIQNVVVGVLFYLLSHLSFFSFSKFWRCCQQSSVRDSHGNGLESNKEEEEEEEGSKNLVIGREDVEMVMGRLGLFCSRESEGLAELMGSDELSRLFDEKEPSLGEMKDAFDVFDGNRDGFIDAEELQRVLCMLGLKEGVEMENCRKMIKNFDENGDGRIDFNEFVKFMESSFNFTE